MDELFSLLFLLGIGYFIKTLITGSSRSRNEKSYNYDYERSEPSNEDIQRKRRASQRAATHRWRYVGKSSRGEKYPNEYYDCDKCGARGIDRGEGIEVSNECKK